MQIEQLPWDTQFFQRRIGRFQISMALDESTLKKLIESSFDTIYIFSAIPQPMLQAQGVPLTDEKLTFSQYIPANTPVSTTGLDSHAPAFHPTSIESPTVSSPALEELFHSSGHQSRFKTDPVFAPFFDALYRQWMANALNRTFADDFLITGTLHAPSGLLVLKRSPVAMNISIIAVSPQHQGQGLGRHLIHLAQQKTLQSNLTHLHVDTQQANHGAVHFYKRMGFEIKERVFIYHLHNEGMLA